MNGGMRDVVEAADRWRETRLESTRFEGDGVAEGENETPQTKGQ